MYSYFQGEGCNFFFEEYQFLVRVATMYTQLCETMRLPANIPRGYLKGVPPTQFIF